MSTMEPTGASEGLSRPDPAPYYSVPAGSLTSVEHPFIVKSPSRAVATLGGEGKIGKIVTSVKAGDRAELYLRPGFQASQPMTSKGVPTGNVLLQVTVPRRTGRKRKRGSDDPFQDCEPSAKPSAGTRDVKDVRRKLQDNPSAFTIKAVGRIDRTFRFRSMHDFVYSTASNPFVQRIETELLPMDYDSVKRFKFDTDANGPIANGSLIPPPTFSHFHIPFNYAYTQNPAVLEVVGPNGSILTFNDQTARKNSTQRVPWGVKEIPQSPSPDAHPIRFQDERIRHAIERMKQLFEKRPIWTRRAIKNLLPDLQWESVAKPAIQYVAYEFQSGPWRSTLVRFGVDPRSDPNCRKYQSMYFHFDKEVTVKKTVYTSGRRLNEKQDQAKQPLVKAQAARFQSHIFDGTSVQLDGRIWQVCDIKDRHIKKLLSTENLRSKCHIKTDGWYHNGTWSKAKILIRAKMLSIIKKYDEIDILDVHMVLTMPDVYQESPGLSARGKGQEDVQSQRWMTTIRASTPERLDDDNEEDHQQESVQSRTDRTTLSSRITGSARKNLQRTFGAEIVEAISTLDASSDEREDDSSSSEGDEDFDQDNEDENGDDVTLDGEDDEETDDGSGSQSEGDAEGGLEEAEDEEDEMEDDEVVENGDDEVREEDEEEDEDDDEDEAETDSNQESSDDSM